MNTSTSLDQIPDIASKRIATLKYLRNAFDGQVFWLNTVLLTKADITEMYSDYEKLGKRAMSALVLGVSLSNLMKYDNPSEFLRSFDLLLNEYDAFINQKERTKRNRTRGNRLRKFSEMEHFSHISMPFIPFDLDLVEVMISSCDMLVEIYSKLASIISDSSSLPSIAVYESFTKIDTRIRKLVLEPLFGEYETAAHNSIANEMRELEVLCTIATA
ncbi:hypothetical protein V1511DRAFT_501069 [Dipodascopsis uninucleata]